MATLLSYTKSDTGSPYIYYKFTATETDRTATKVTLKVTAYAYLATSISSLGTGKGLKAGISFNGGDSYTTWTLKSTSSAWSGTTVHSASRTITVSASATTTKLSSIKVRVTRSDSTGSAGKLYATSANSMSISTYATPTEPEVSASSVELGDSFTISLAGRQSSGYTHTLKWSFGSLSGTLVTKGTAASYTYSTSEVPSYTADAFGAQIPTSSSGKLTITCLTYTGSTYVGKETVAVQMTVPSYTLAPTLALSEANTDNPFTGYVQNISKVKIDTTCQSYYGATLKYQVYVSGTQVGSSSSCTTGTLLDSGSVTISVTVSDTRSSTEAVTVSDTITVLAYSYPSVELKISQSGDNIIAVMSGTVSNIEDNTATLSIVYGPLGGNTETEDVATALTGNFENDPFELEIDGTVTNSFVAYIEDKYTSVPSNEVVTGVVCISRYASGKGVTLFEKATGNGFKVGDGQPAHFTGTVSMDSPLGFTSGGLGAKSREQALINLLGYTPSYIQVRATALGDIYSTSLNYFMPFYSTTAPTVYSSTKGNLTLTTDSVTFGDRENQTVYGVRVGANINMVRVNAMVYFTNNTSSRTTVTAGIYRWRDGALTTYTLAATSLKSGEGVYGSCCPTAIMYVEEGDFIFIGAYKAVESCDVSVGYTSGRTTMIVEAIG